ncbi:MAG: hypothetical protein GXP26_05070 [Planctomycetes bacterium]|nr:hypothetical protein [Planctomycetota bacterium]
MTSTAVEQFAPEYHDAQINRAFDVIERVAEVTPDDEALVPDNLGFFTERGGQINFELLDGSTICICDAQPGKHYRFRVLKVLASHTIVAGKMFLVLPSNGCDGGN